MEDEKTIFCSNCGEKLNDDKFCSNCGNGENKSNKKLIIVIIVLIGILTIVGGILLANHENRFTMEVTVGGERFYLPEGSEIESSPVPNNEAGGHVMYRTPNDGFILISVGADNPATLDESRQSIIDNGFIPTDTTIKGYSGVKFDDGISELFLFEKNGKSVEIVIQLDNGDTDEYFSKIIG